MALNVDYGRVSQIVSQYRSEWLMPDKTGADTPRIPATALLGNGDVGAFSRSDYGSVAFSFSKSNFREYKGSPLAIGTLTVEVVDGRKTGFYECQDILNARVITETGAIRAESFIVKDKNIFIMKLQSEKDVRIRFTLASHKSKNRPVSSAINFDRILIQKQTAFGGSHTRAAIIAAAVIGTGTGNIFSRSGTASNEFNLYEGSEVCIAVSVCCGRPDTSDPYSRAMFTLDKIKTLQNIDALEKEHNEQWRDYWSSSFIDLDTSDNNIASIQKYYYGAQYLLGSGISENACAPGLYGIWHATDESPWKSDYHLNYNFVSAFYGCASSNRPNQLLPACIAVNDYTEKGRKNATDINEWRKFEKSFIDRLISEGRISEENGVPGAVLFPVGIAPYGTADGSYWNETMNATYSAYPMVEYYHSTMDESFRRQILYPYLKNVLVLLDAWLEKNENGGYSLFAGYNEGSWSKNPAVELAAYKLCLREAISTAVENGVDDELCEKWKDYLHGLPQQPTGTVLGKKVLSLAEKEYTGKRFVPMQDCVPEDGNAIPLDCIIPGGVFGYFSPEEDLTVLRNTVEVFDIRNAWENINNFPRLFAYAVNCGYSTENTLKAFAGVIDSSIQKNLTVDDEVHGFEKAGAVRAVNDMLLLCDRGVIKLFPARLKADSAFCNLRTYGAFLVSARYSAEKGAVVSASLYSENGGLVRIAKEDLMNKITDSEGKPVEYSNLTLDDRKDVQYVEFNTQPGEIYTLIQVG